MPHEFPGYHALQRLHLSARSSVERVTRSHDGALLVLKQPSGQTSTAQALRRVQHEYTLLSSLHGPGVVRAHAVVRDAGRAGIVLDDAGDALAIWLTRRRFSLGEALDIGVALACTLVRIHDAGVVHQDINPSNVVYDPAGGAVTIIDFDIASCAQASASDRPAVVEGTLAYLAPEQTGRLKHRIDGRSDLYSLGATLYELVTGRRPFDGDDLALVHAHLATRPARLDEIEPAIPAVVADIVARLLEKAPEQRYQTARGVAADLAECRRQLAETGGIAGFPIGARDASPRFALSERLYGRDAEVRALVDAFARTAGGGVEVVAVTGPAGAGKSALLRELHAPVTAQHGHLAVGKFDQLQRDVPYSAVARALGELAGQILIDPALDHWQAAIRRALGQDAALVVAVVPDLARIVDDPVRGEAGARAVPELDPDAAQRRLAAALTRLVQVFATRAHPLVIVLDDMQWADAASFQLLVQLAISEHTEALLVIEASRDGSAGAGDPSASALGDLERRGVTVSRIPLAPLSALDTAELVGDALHQPPDDVAEVAGQIWRKTHGNPFFLRQFLQTMSDEGVIAFDPGTNRFALDAAALDRARITDNVADLLAAALARLPEPTREVLVVAAAIGGRFDVAVLAIAAGQPERCVHAALGPAVAAGLIVPAGRTAYIDDAVVSSSHFAFQHDRVQQAAYEAAPVAVRERLHLSIGRHLLASSGTDGLADRLFDIVHHLNEARALVRDEAELARFVELAVLAAQKARRAGAFDVAATMLRAVCASRTWRDHGALVMRCHVELAAVLVRAGLAREAREVVHAAEAHATPRERATLEALAATICSNLSDLPGAIACARRAAALLGVDLPADPAAIQAAVSAQIAGIMAAIPAAGVAAWIDLPVMQDPDRREVMRVLFECLPAAYHHDPSLMVLMCVTLVALSLRHGNSEESARGYIGFAIVLWRAGQLELAFRFGKLGVDLIRRTPDHPIAAPVQVGFAGFASPWYEPLDRSLDLLRSTMTRAVELGDAVTVGYASVFLSTYGLLHGLPLRDVLEETRRLRTLCTRLGLEMGRDWMGCFAWHARSLMGIPPGAGEQDFAYADLEATVFASSRSQNVVAMVRLHELERRFWAGDLAGVVALAPQIERTLPAIAAMAPNAEFRLYLCLAHLALGDAATQSGAEVGPSAGVEISAEIAAKLDAMCAELARYARACPHNFGHMSALVEAELARVRGDVTRAIAGYHAAIDSAAQSGFLKIEILAHQRLAQWWLARDKPAFAALHLAEARDRCEVWGAQPHARALELRIREIGGTLYARGTTNSRSAVATTLDFAAVAKASHAIGSDLMLDSLLGKLIAILVENTGAQSGAIALLSDDGLRLHASWQAGRAVVTPGGVALGATRDVSEGIVHYVTRTRECLVLDDASRHPTFRADPYVRARAPRSVLCAPIVHNEGVLGAVYLENNLVAAAFTVERLEALGIILSQLAISIENAMMFARLAAYRDQLEDLVAARTRELTLANAQLREQALVRERMENELRLAQKLQSVGQLAAGVAHEINTPIQYVGDNISFLAEAFGALSELVAAYDAAIDAEHGRADVAALRRAAEDADLAYLREHVPAASALAQGGVQRVARIVQAMRAFSHPDERDQAPTSLNAALETTLAVARSEYAAVADVETALGEIPEVVCYAGEINQVFLNLIVNAAHAIADVVQDTGRRGTIAIATRCDGAEHVVVTISDTGTGIPDAIRDRVFDPFFTTKPVGKGTGQGLALARTAIVDRHGGSIGFETRPGQGTTFFVRLPVRGVASAPGVPATPRAAAPPTGERDAGPGAGRRRADAALAGGDELGLDR